MTRSKSGTEPFRATIGEVEGECGSFLPTFHNAMGQVTVEGIGPVSISMSAVGKPVIYLSFPVPPGVQHRDAPPLLYVLPIEPIVRAALPAAEARYRSGEPAVWIEEE